MAIKGKGKTRRRTVASGPKPVYVEPPKPPWRRRWVQLTALAVVLAVIGVGVTVALVHRSDVRHRDQVAARRAKEAAIVGQFGSQVDLAVQSVTQPFQDSRRPFPDLTQAAAQVKPDQPFDSHSVAVFRVTPQLAGNAVNAIQKVPTAALVSGHPDLLPLIDSQNDMVQSLKVYQQASSALFAADKATGAARTALIGQGQNLLQIGATLFNNAYQKLLNLRTQFGVATPPQPPPQRASPTPSPSPTPASTPSAQASGKGAKATPTKKSKNH